MNKETLINRIEIMGTETSENYPHEQMVDREVVIKLVNQLDEPEKVVVPQFVADWIEEFKANLDVDIFEEVEDIRSSLSSQNMRKEHRLWEWIFSNQNDFMRAWLDYPNIEVEKEQLYRVVMHGTDGLLLTLEGNEYYFDEPLDYVGERPNVRQEFTKSEIKAIDERYLDFKVPVEGYEYDE